ncbi:MAG: type I glyceraldehyde-3-phosphate dehydrogenase [Candidatus Marinimicrobia bacterium]|nr:type I glyceraldehyde-3-phosphate dehydrogenase [Candidatus Neomarinimicrobiota bacterium]
MPTRIAINGLGRIGQAVFKVARQIPDLEVVAVNDLMENENMIYLLKYDTVYGRYSNDIDIQGDELIVEGDKYKVLHEKDPEKLPWQEMNVDIVLECTGFFTDKEGASKHIKAGAKNVIISAPAKGDVPTFVKGVNEKEFDPSKDKIISNASCTTNCLAPVAKVLEDAFGVERGLMTTIHSYTSTQSVVDGPNSKDMRRGRAAAENLVLTTTGAAKATCQVIPSLNNEFNGRSVRVPTATVSLVDLVAVLGKEVSVEEINAAFKKAATGELKDILCVTEEQLVSTDFKQNNCLATIDLPSTMVIKNLAKVYAWYDNEWGYAYGLAKMAEYIGGKLK